MKIRKIRKITMGIMSVAVRFIIVALVVILLLRGAIFTYQFGYSVFMDEAAAAQGAGRDVEVTLLEGSNVRDISKQLEALGVIDDANIFYVQALVSGHNKDLKGGDYVLNTSMTPSEIMETLSEGSDEQ